MNKAFCIFSANYLPNIGGVEKYTKNLAEQLIKEGDRAVVVTNNVFNLADWETTPEGVDLVRLPCYPSLNGRYPIPKKNATYRSLMNRLLEIDCDYVMVNTRFYPHSLAGIRYAEQKGIRPILLDHGSAHLTLGNKVIDIAVEFVEHATTVMVKKHSIDYYGVSQASLNWLKHFGIQGIGVLYNSIDASRFAADTSCRDWRSELNVSDDTMLVSFTGRLIPEKGIEALLDAAKRVQGLDVHFALAGDGPQREMVEGSGLSNLSALGRVEANDIAALLKQSDVFCLPTRSEGFSTSLLEAAACSTMPIVTHVGGVDELMPSSDYGIELSAASGSEIAEAIAYLVKHPEEIKRRSNNIHQRVVQNFSWANTAAMVREACERANAK